MSVTGGFTAVVTNHTFATLNSKLATTYVTMLGKNFNHNDVNLRYASAA